MSNASRKDAEGRGLAEMTAVAGAKCRRCYEFRDDVVVCTDKVTPQGFIADHAANDTKVRTDDRRAFV